MRLFDKVFEIVAWCKIVLGPLLLGGFLGLAAYLGLDKSTGGLVAGITLALLGLVVGVLWANQVWRKYGTMYFISRIHATPDIGPKEEEKVKTDDSDTPSADVASYGAQSPITNRK